jgi:hypothetical protein
MKKWLLILGLMAILSGFKTFGANITVTNNILQFVVCLHTFQYFVIEENALLGQLGHNNIRKSFYSKVLFLESLNLERNNVTYYLQHNARKTIIILESNDLADIQHKMEKFGREVTFLLLGNEKLKPKSFF